MSSIGKPVYSAVEPSSSGPNIDGIISYISLILGADFLAIPLAG